MKKYIYIIVGLMIVVVGLYLRPVPKTEASLNLPKLPAADSISIDWPGYGQAAFGAVGYGVLDTSGQQKPVPIASIAKVVTALAVLNKKPLSVGQQGPKITIGSDDIDLYKKYLAQNGSVVPINFGEEISEYQMLQALLLPSGNNIADSLVTWAFGSQSAYLTYANSYVKSLGLNQTKLADASGFSPKTVSSAQDLVVLGNKALSQPVLAGIVSQEKATLPVAGTVHNVNWLLGDEGVNGIKTGNTDQAGGCFLFSAKRTIEGQAVEIIGAVLGSPDSNSPNQAIEDSRTIIEGSDNNFQATKIVKKGQVIGQYRTKWGSKADIIATDDLTVASWKAKSPSYSDNLNKVSGSVPANQKVGSVIVKTGQQAHSVDVELKQKISAPSPLWRVFHF